MPASAHSIFAIKVANIPLPDITIFIVLLHSKQEPKNMKLELKRIFKGENYTIGKLYVNGEYFCDTLEDKDRGLSQEMGEPECIRQKVMGSTAIPYGTYEVTTRFVSSKFKDTVWGKMFSGRTPRLLNVPAFTGVLIHPGNTNKDTQGCILVGENKEKGKVINSREKYICLMDMLYKQRTPIELIIS